uniref:Uncharacterized protein n=1 Tax=Ditylenchus dipsaci TaxID=166011 RepID=A0A915EGD3_9BILA
MSNYRICSCGQFDSNHVCRLGGGAHGSAVSQLSQSISGPSLCCSLIQAGRYIPPDADQPYANYALNWGFNPDDARPDEIKHRYTSFLPRRYHVCHPVRVGIYWSLYKCDVPSH